MTMDVGDAPGTLKLRPNLVKWTLTGLMLLTIAGGMAFLYASTPADAESRARLFIAGALAGLFGLGTLISFWMLLPNSAYLLLTPAGFTIRTLLRRQEYRWEDVEAFEAITFRGAPRVIFTLSPYGKVGRIETLLGRLDKAVWGGDDNVPDTYGMHAEQLAALMNHWRKRFAGMS